jgi:transaldolase
MLAQAREYHAWSPEHVVIKVPMGLSGLRVARALEQVERIPVNMTYLMSFQQAYLAAHAGASFVSLLLGRIRDLGHDGLAAIRETRAAIDREGLRARLIVGSVRQVSDVGDALAAGAHIVTVPPAILRKMAVNPRSEETHREFLEVWRSR